MYITSTCYHSVQKRLSSSSLSLSLKKKHTDSDTQNYNLPVVLYGCETWSLPFREQRRLRMSENRVLRRTFGAKKDEATGNGEN
jgi:hypothetical protein